MNGSWGYQNDTGTDVFSLTVDGMARQSRRTVVWAAGNEGPATNTLRAPGTGYNGLVVGALGADTDASPYRNISTFSSRGPVDYQDPVTGFVSGGRARVDITAPGQNLTLAFYGGTTGGNKGGTDSSNGATNFYTGQASGTSFAAPIVSGGAALLCDVGYDRFGGGDSLDATVIKTVLLNSADKPVGWSNGQTVTGGVTQTSQGLDYTYGAGIMNLDRAFDQYTAGTTNVSGFGSGNLGFVQAIGWDLGRVSDTLSNNDYYFGDSLLGGSSFTATLNWMANRQYVSTASGGTITANNLGLTDLNLQLWTVINGVPASIVAQSASLYNNTEHFSFLLPSTGNYMLRVVWAGERFDLAGNRSEDYGVAWSAVSAPVVVPEPGTICLLGLGVACVILRIRPRAKILA